MKPKSGKAHMGKSLPVNEIKPRKQIGIWKMPWCHVDNRSSSVEISYKTSYYNNHRKPLVS